MRGLVGACGLLALLNGCGGDGPADEGGGGFDLAHPADLAVEADGSVPPDGARKPDQAAPGDLAGADDLAGAGDLVTVADLVASVDLFHPPDATMLKDMSSAPDLATKDLSAPDLSIPDLSAPADLAAPVDLAVVLPDLSGIDVGVMLNLDGGPPVDGNLPDLKLPPTDLVGPPDLTAPPPDLAGGDLKQPSFAKWVATNGPLGGAVTRVGVNAAGTVFAASGGIVFQRAANAKAWSVTSKGLWGAGSSHLAFGPQGLILYNTFENVFRSTDGGATWTPVYWTAAGDRVVSLAMDAKGRTFATIARSAMGSSTYDILRSKDDGDTFAKVATATMVGGTYAGIATSGDVELVAMSTLGIYRSTDGGDSFSAVTAGLPNNGSVHRVSLAGTTAYAATNQGLYRSTDSGATWAATSLTGFVDGVVVDSKGNVVAHLGGREIAVSVDNGAHFTKQETPIASNDVYIGPDDTLFLGSPQGEGVDRTNNAHFFGPWNEGLRMHAIIAMAARNDAGALSKTGDVYAAGSAGGVWRSTDGGSSWIPVVPLPSATFRSIAVSPAGAVFIGSVGNVIKRSTNNGATFDELTMHPALKGVFDIAFGGAKNVVVIAAGNGVFRSVDQGSTIAAVAGAPAAAYRFAHAKNGDLLVAASDGLYRSSDDGQSFTKVGLSKVTYVAVGPDDTIYAQDNGTFTRSIDGGVSFTPLAASGLSAPIGFGSDGALYVSYFVPGDKANKVAPKFGVYRSIDRGDTLTDLSAGLDLASIYSFTVDGAGMFYAGTATGVYRASP